MAPKPKVKILPLLVAEMVEAESVWLLLAILATDKAGPTHKLVSFTRHKNLLDTTALDFRQSEEALLAIIHERIKL